MDFTTIQYEQESSWTHFKIIKTSHLTYISFGY